MAHSLTLVREYGDSHQVYQYGAQEILVIRELSGLWTAYARQEACAVEVAAHADHDALLQRLPSLF